MKPRYLGSGQAVGALCIVVCLVLVLSGCGRHTRPHSADPPPPRPRAKSSIRPPGSRLSPRGLSFTQDGLHNCGTIAMLISWANAHRQEAADLVRRQHDGNYLVSFRGADAIAVAADDLVAAAKSKLVRTDQQDPWPRVVLTAFVKLKCRPGPLDFRATDWIYAGEIGECLTDAPTGVFEIKPETLDRKGRIQVGKPVALSVLNAKLSPLRGRPLVAYTNRRVHIWAVMDYDAARSRVLVRNPRRRTSEWLPVSDFSQRFQLLVFASRGRASSIMVR